MISKILCSILTVGISGAAAFAQSTLTGANFNPVALDIYVSNVCNTTGVAAGPRGANITWSFLSLTPSTSMPPLDTGIVSPCILAAHCVSGSTFGINNPALTITNSIYTDATRLSQTGLYVSATENSTYTNSMDQLRYPFTYLDSFVDSYSGTINFLGLSGTLTGNITVVCDGYGTLKVPGKTFTNVLRVHSMQKYIDSVDLLGVAIDSYLVNSYTWYMPNYHSALMTISTLTQLSTGTEIQKLVSYTAKSLLSAPSTSSPISMVELYPNPATNELNIKLPATINEALNITLTDMLGRTVLTEQQSAGKKLVTLQTTGLPRGLYMVKLQCGTDTETRKIQLQ
jgi:hypothetical protein